MTRKDLKPLRNNCKQLALMVLGFAVCISLLEAKGFVVWAKRLDAGPTQQMVLEATQAQENAWSVIAEPVVNFRPQALEYLTQHGWSDMPADGERQPDQTTDQTENQEDVLPPTQSSRTDAPEITNAPHVPSTNGVEVAPQGVGESGTTVGDVTVILPSSPEEPAPFDADGKLVPLPALKAEQSRHIVLAGDSMMAVGLAPQLQRELAAFKATSSTAKAYRAATGLARPDVFNWQKEYPLMVGRKTPDVVIVAIGGNDTQNLDVNKKVLTIGSDEWNAVYEERLMNYLNMLTKDGATVLWIKLPPMRPNKYNRNVASVNAIAQKVVAANPKAIWWDVSERFVNSKGQFQEFAVIPPGKRQVRIRQADGIHLTDQGAQLITGDIVTWLNLAAPIAPAAREDAVEPAGTSVVQETMIAPTNQS